MNLIGTEAIKRNLDRSIVVMSKNLEESLIEVGERGVGILDINTPVDKGRLRNSMSYTIASKVIAPFGGSGRDILRKSKNKKRVIIGTNVEYAPYVEYRSKNGSAGFMLRSYKQLIPIAKKIMQEVIKRGFKRSF